MEPVRGLVGQVRRISICSTYIYIFFRAKWVLVGRQVRTFCELKTNLRVLVIEDTSHVSRRIAVFHRLSLQVMIHKNITSILARWPAVPCEACGSVTHWVSRTGSVFCASCRPSSPSVRLAVVTVSGGAWTTQSPDVAATTAERATAAAAASPGDIDDLLAGIGSSVPSAAVVATRPAEQVLSPHELHREAMRQERLEWALLAFDDTYAGKPFAYDPISGRVNGCLWEPDVERGRLR